MPYHRKGYPSAKREADWLCKTYGADFAQAFVKWRDDIVATAPDNPNALCLVSVNEVFNPQYSTLAHLWERWQDLDGLQRLKALKSTIESRRPPFELLAAEASFFALDSFWLKIIAIFDIDRVEQTVTFIQFIWYGEDEG